MLLTLSRYAFGVMPLPQRYVTWFEQRSAARMASS